MWLHRIKKITFSQQHLERIFLRHRFFNYILFTTEERKWKSNKCLAQLLFKSRLVERFQMLADGVGNAKVQVKYYQLKHVSFSSRLASSFFFSPLTTQQWNLFCSCFCVFLSFATNERKTCSRCNGNRHRILPSNGEFIF